MIDKMPKGKFASSAKVGEKGQIVIPKELRDMFNIKSGDTLLVLGDQERGIAIVPFEKYQGFADKVFSSNFDDKGDK